MNKPAEQFIEDVQKLERVGRAGQKTLAGRSIGGATSGVEQLVSVLAPVAAVDDTLTYSELAATRGGSLKETYRELSALLGEVSESEDRAGRGMLTAVVVGAHSGIPGPGFFSLARRLGREGTNESIWRHERELLRTVWSPVYDNGSDPVAARVDHPHEPPDVGQPD